MIKFLQNHLEKLHVVPQRQLRLRGAFFAIRLQVTDKIFVRQFS